MDKTIKKTIAILLLLLSIGTLHASASPLAVQMREQMEIENIKTDIEFLSNIPTRVTGYSEAKIASKYIFDRFTKLGLEELESREFQLTVPIDRRDGKLEIIDENGKVHRKLKISPLWSNLVRTSLIPTGGLTTEIFYIDGTELEQFDGKEIGGFWHKVKNSDQLEKLADRFGVSVGSIIDDILNAHLQKSEDGIDNDEDGKIDEYGEMPLLSDIANWSTDQLDNDGDGKIDEEGESSIFIPRGSVILTDFNSSNSWINAPMLGAKAIVFIEPETTIRGEAENKFLTVPANIPRFWISRQNAEILKSNIAEKQQQNRSTLIKINSTVTWENRTGQNIRGLLKGSDPKLKDELIVITAHYDSMSVVPAIAPGAEPTSSIATMLELARVLTQEKFRPGRSVLFVAIDGHFQGLAGMRSFMEGIGQNIVGLEADSAGTPTLRGLRRGLSEDLFQLEELGRKIPLSIDRNVLVQLPSDFAQQIHQTDQELQALELALNELAATEGKVDWLRNAQRRSKESSNVNASQHFTEKEQTQLAVSLAKLKEDSLETTQFLWAITDRLDRVKSQALASCYTAQRELVENLALPIARLDLWAIDRLKSELKSGKIGENYNDTPESSYLKPIENSNAGQTLPTENVPEHLKSQVKLLSENLQTWEISDPRKFTLFYSQKLIIDRHLNIRELETLSKARKILANRNRQNSELIESERKLLEKVQTKISKDIDDVEFFRNILKKLSVDRTHLPENFERMESYLTEKNITRLRQVQKSIEKKINLLENREEQSTLEIQLDRLTENKKNILEVGLRNARSENKRIQSLLEWHENLAREYLAEEILLLKHYLTADEVNSAIEIRRQLAAQVTEENLLTLVENRAKNDVVALEEILENLGRYKNGLPDKIKALLRDNLPTLRNARFRNIQSKIEVLSRIDASEYQQKIASIEKAIALKDRLNRYYNSLFVSIDLSSRSDKFGVFNKGWFYDQQPEQELLRKFAPIGEQLAEFANQANFGERLEKLWHFTDDQIRQKVMAYQWEVASWIDSKHALEGKTLESLIAEDYEAMKWIGGVSRLMRMQFEYMKTHGEPPADMVRDLPEIRSQIKRFLRNDVLWVHKERKNQMRKRKGLTETLKLRNRKISQLTSAELGALKALLELMDLGGSTNFVNTISASSHKNWRTYIPGKIAFDSEVATLSGKTGIAFATIDDARPFTDTPLDTVDRMSLEKNGNLHRQVKTLASILFQVLRSEAMPTTAQVENFYCNVFGDVVEYDAREGALPKKPVADPIVVFRRKHKTMMGVRGDLFTRGDHKGSFEMAGLAIEGRATYRSGGAQEIEAYILDENSGDIAYAPELGNFGAKLLPNKIPIDRSRRGCRIVVFPCVSTTIYDLVDQRYLRTLQELSIYDADTDSEPEKFGMSKPWQQEGSSMVEPIALTYSEPGKRIKLSMSYGQVGKRLLLTKAGHSGTKNPTLYTGNGFLVGENSSIRLTPYVVASDMWWIDENRTQFYKRFGISSERLDQLHQYARQQLDEAQIALGKLDYSEALKLARSAWGYESRAYPDVKKTGNDVVNGVMFYLALLLPFAYFMERLTFNFANVNRQIGGTFAIFLLVFFFLTQVHPAFQLAATPLVILVAFIVLALSLLVISIIVQKFSNQLEQLRQESSKVHKADVGRIAASAAAFRLGISNMRKRGGRTILTSITLILLTFTVISFTSVKTFMRPNRTTLATVTPRYTGILLRNRTWNSLEEPVFTTIKNAVEKVEVKADRLQKLFPGRGETLSKIDGDKIRFRNVVVPRAWYQSSGSGTQSFIQLTRSKNIKDPNAPPRNFAVTMLLGMTSDEPKITGIDRTLQHGRWFDRGENYVCILPQGIAEGLGIGPSDVGKATVSVYGADFTVIGILGLGFKELQDNDGEELTPVDLQLMSQQRSTGSSNGGDDDGGGELQKSMHLAPDSVAILPYEIVMNQGGTLRSVAVNMGGGTEQFLSAKEKLDLVLSPLMNRIALDLFVGRGTTSYLYSSIGMTSFSGAGNLFVPLLIASLIVLNTMLGAVYERMREIGVYSSVGLAPIHIAFLFLAEASVYSIIGAVFGYLLGQVIATTLVHFGWLAGLTLNYSSMSTIFATLIVMLVVIGSTLYPAIKAGRMAVPDIERKWKLPEPEGDLWHFDLPFTVLGEEALGLNVFMSDYFEAHADDSAKDFYNSEVSLSTSDQGGDGKSYGLSTTVWLEPYDLGVSQKIGLLTSQVTGEEDLYRISLEVTRKSGAIASWKRVNRHFLNLLRRQLLIWRTFGAEVRAEFHERGRNS